MGASNLIPAGVLIAVAVAGSVALRRFSNRVRIGFDAVCFVAISLLLLREGAFPGETVHAGHTSAEALWLRAIGGAWWLLGARVVVALLWFTLHRDRRSRASRLVSDLAAAAIYAATAAVVLNSVFAVPITGVLATSGVLAIVLGLALQNTLADVFAGIAVGIEAPFRVGDRVQIGDKVEGLVVQVNWRSIHIETDGEDVAIIPNSLVAKAEIINRSFPTQQRAVSVELSCPVASDPERVIETLLQATLLCPSILQAPAPSATLTRLGSKNNHFKIAFFVQTTAHLSAQKGALLVQARRQLHYANLLLVGAGVDVESDGPRAGSAAQLMSSLTVFEGLSSGQVMHLAASLDLVDLEPGEVLFRQGGADASLYVIASGVLTLEHRTDASVSSIVGSIGAGDYIGELGLLTGEAHAVTAAARTHCHIYRLSRDAIAPLLADNPELVSAFDKSVRRGLERLNREVAARATVSVGGKGQLLARMRGLFHVQNSQP
jgi:small-conductance mechanosensitive channel/CRP-like cAMP-binding protein